MSDIAGFLRTSFSATVTKIENKILETNCLVQKTDFSTKVWEIENKLPTRYFWLDLINRQPLRQKKVTLEVE